MTINEFLDQSSFCSYEVSVDIRENDKLVYCFEGDERWTIRLPDEWGDKIIKHFEFTTSGDNSGESYLNITFDV